MPAVHVRERPHGDFVATRLVRLIRQPVPVGRQLAGLFEECRVYERLSLPGLAPAPSPNGLRRAESQGLPERSPGSITSTRKSTPVLGTASRTISRVPSGEIEIGTWRLGLVVNRSTIPVLSAACQNRLLMPARADVKMMRRLSGVHTGL